VRLLTIKEDAHRENKSIEKGAKLENAGAQITRKCAIENKTYKTPTGSRYIYGSSHQGALQNDDGACGNSTRHAIQKFARSTNEDKLKNEKHTIVDGKSWASWCGCGWRVIR
jgi:hypothetical protein